ncbi:MAG: OadG family protein [Clostridiaceae bacterium]|jgi:hypothetical protein|nr:OadG family protein [Clostridiaceae bacterium]
MNPLYNIISAAVEPVEAAPVIWWQTLLAVLVVVVIVAAIVWYIRSGKELLAPKIAVLKAKIFKHKDDTTEPVAPESVAGEAVDDGELIAAITAAVYAVISEEAAASNRPSVGFIVKKIRRL